MTFFNVGTDSSGNATLSVLPQWWYYPVATLPLTIIVFIIWRIWQQKRAHRIASQDSANIPTDVVSKRRGQRFGGFFGSGEKRAGVEGNGSLETDASETSLSRTSVAAAFP